MTIDQAIQQQLAQSDAEALAAFATEPRRRLLVDNNLEVLPPSAALLPVWDSYGHYFPVGVAICSNTRFVLVLLDDHGNYCRTAMEYKLVSNAVKFAMVLRGFVDPNDYSFR